MKGGTDIDRSRRLLSGLALFVAALVSIGTSAASARTPQDTRSKSAEPSSRSDIKEVLKNEGPLGRNRLPTEKLVEYLEHSDPEIVVAVADIIAWRAAHDRDAEYGEGTILFARQTIPALSRRLSDKDTTVLRACVKAIGAHRTFGFLAFDSIVPLLAHESDTVAVDAAAALRQVSRDWDPLSEAARSAALLPLLRRGPEARAAMLAFVEMVYPIDAACFGALLGCLSDSDANVRTLTSNLLWRVASNLQDHASEIEAAFLRETDPDAQVALLRLVEATAVDSPAVRKKLLKLADETKTEVARAAWVCLISVPGLPGDLVDSLRHRLSAGSLIPWDSTRPIDGRLVPMILSRISTASGRYGDLTRLLRLAKRGGASFHSVQSALLSRLRAAGTDDLLFAEAVAELENYRERDAAFAQRLTEVFHALSPKRRVDAAMLLRYLGAHARPLAASAWETWNSVSKDSDFDPGRGSSFPRRTERFDLLAVLPAVSSAARPPLDELIATYDGTRLEARSELLRILVFFGPDDRRVIERLKAAMWSEFVELAHWAVALAERIEPREIGGALLRDILEHENLEVRAAAALRLARAGYRSERIADVLIEAIERRDRSQATLVPEDLSWVAADAGSLPRAERLLRAVLSNRHNQPAVAVELAIQASLTIGVAAGDVQRWHAVLDSRPKGADWRVAVCRLSVAESERSRVVDACLSHLSLSDGTSACVAVDLLNRLAARSTKVHAAVLEFAEDVYREGPWPMGIIRNLELADWIGLASTLKPWLAVPAPPEFGEARLEAIRSAASNGHAKELVRGLWRAAPKTRTKVVVDPLLPSGFATLGLHDYHLRSSKGSTSQALDDFTIEFGSRPHACFGNVVVQFQAHCTVAADGEISADVQAIFVTTLLYLGPSNSLPIREARLAVSPVDRRLGGTLWAYLEIDTDWGRFTTLGRAILDPAVSEIPATKPTK